MNRPRITAILLILVSMTETGLQAQPVQASEEDQEIAQRAFEHLRYDPRTAASIAETRLDDPSPLTAKLRGRLLWIAGSGLTLTHEYERGQKRLEEAESIARKNKDAKLLRRTLRYESAALFELSRYQEASDAAAEALAISEELQDTSPYVGILHNERGNCEGKLGNYESALTHFQNALEIARGAENPGMELMVMANLSLLFDEFGKTEKAIEFHRSVIERSRQSGTTLVEAHALVNLGGSLLENGQIEEAVEAYTAGKALAADLSDRKVDAISLMGLGDIDRLLGRKEKAREKFSQALNLFEQLGDESSQIELQERLSALDSPEFSTRHVAMLEQGLTRAQEIGDIPLCMKLCASLVEHYKTRGQYAEALDRLELVNRYQEQLWNDGNMQALAKAESQINAIQRQQELDEVTRSNELRRIEVQSQRRAIIMMAIFLSLGLLTAGLLWKTLVDRNRMLRQLSIANAEIRKREQVQISLERSIAEQQKSESLCQMAAGIAHDFNNLLTGIVSLAELGAISPKTSEKDEMFRHICDTSIKASELTSQFGQFIGRPPAEPQQTELASTTMDLKELLTSITRTKAKLIFNMNSKGYYAAIDPNLFSQIVVNLVTNSCQSIDKPGAIQISLSDRRMERTDLAPLILGSNADPGQFCVVQVQDDGSGIASDIQNRIFDPYYSTKKDGRGLGLASVLGIVRSCRGAIQVDSTPGKGSTFSVFIPSVPSIPLPHDVRPIRRSDKAKIPNAPCVLFVEDERIVREMMSKVLRNSGVEVVEADSAEQGLELFRKHLDRLDYVVSDYSLPGKTGVWLAEQVKATGSEIPFVICSGYTQEEVTTNPSVAEFLPKPYVAAQLLQLLVGLGNDFEIRRSGKAASESELAESFGS